MNGKQLLVKLIIFIGATFAPATVFSQKQPVTPACKENFSLVKKYLQNQNYSAAITPWRKLFADCPSMSKDIFNDGATIYEKFILDEKNETTISKFVDTLMTIYDKEIYYFGENGNVLSRKGTALFKYAPQRVKETHKVLEKAIAWDGFNAQCPIMEMYIITSSQVCKSGELSKKLFAQNYFRVHELMQEDFPNKEPGKCFELKSKIDTIYVHTLTCDDQVQVFKPQMEQKIIEQLKRYVYGFTLTNCYDNEVYAEAAETLYKYEPSAQTALNLARLFRAKKDFQKANSYYSGAVEFESHDKNKAIIMLEYAEFYRDEKRNFAQARTYARRAASLNSSWGKPYIFIGDLYGSAVSECNDELKGTSVYWISTECYEIAGKIDSTFRTEAELKIASNAKQYPDQKQLEKAGLKPGDSYRIKCWINEKTTVRPGK